MTVRIRRLMIASGDVPLPARLEIRSCPPERLDAAYRPAAACFAECKLLQVVGMRPDPDKCEADLMLLRVTPCVV